MLKLLEGYRVVESATLFNGGYLGMLLADLGADVIKVESPFQGDYLRDFLGQITPHHSPAHLQINKNKRSVTLDLRTEPGLEAFWRLLRSADVFVDGNAAEACSRLGIGYDDQCRVKADIVYCQYSGFGAHGPYSPIPTHGEMMNALVAARPVEMGPDGLVRRRQATEGFGGTETGGEGTAAGGAFAATYVAAALARRERTGEGCYIDVSAADSVVSAAWVGAVYALNEHRIVDRNTLPERTGGSYQAAKYQFYETKDQRFMLFCAIEHKFWDNFCRGVDRPDLMAWKDESAPVDWGTHPELRRILQAIFHERTQQEWTAFAITHDVAMGPALTDVAELLDDPHLAARQILIEGCHPDAGPFTYIGVPAIVDGQHYEVRRPAPALGADTDDILAELGYTTDDIEGLRRLRVV